MENEEVDLLKHHINQTTDLMGSLSNSMRQMSLTALDLQALALGKKHQIEKAIDRVDDLGDILDDLTGFLEKLICCYIIRHERLGECELNEEVKG